MSQFEIDVVNFSKVKNAKTVFRIECDKNEKFQHKDGTSFQSQKTNPM